jgi:homotetrameric NADPH-dependent glutamate synthase
MYPILRREQFSETSFLWEVLAPDVARSAEAGHFVMVRLGEGGERIPLTVADFDRDKGTVTIVVQALGKTTRQMRDDFEEGDAFSDFVGPLGLPQHVSKVGHVVLVGGGLGVAPVYPQLRAFRDAGNRTTSIMGFRSKGLIFWEDRFRAASDELLICTDDGSYGRPGFVTDALRHVIETDRPDLVIAIGPLPMMHACVEVTRPYGVPTMVSLNTIMVDGTGMCGSCRVTVDGKVKFACVDGPDFDGHLVDFDELKARQRRFKPEEERAAADHDHVCNLEKLLVGEGRKPIKKITQVEPHQHPMPERDAGIRATNFEEVNLGYSAEAAFAEAERCLQCRNPTCVSGCPVGIDIPGFIRHVLVRDLEGAIERIYESSIFPSICGRVCPQETQCESQCVIGKRLEPVAIGRLERFVGDHARPPKARPPLGAGRLGKVAIVGSGPGGLGAAADLARFGAEVTVYEALHVVGGVLRYGIPSFRLPRDIIDREVERLKDVGVRFETNKVVGKTFTIPQLMQEKGFDAVFVAAGAGAPSFLGIPGENAGRVYSANEFLTRVNLMGGDRFPFLDTPVSLGKSVVVIGAGNTAMDCLRVSKRIGVPKVRCVYRRSKAEAPARIEELRHAEEEGIEFFFLHGPKEILLEPDGAIRGMKVERMELGAPDEKGRRKPVGTGEIIELDCDTVIYALGTNANPIVGQATPGLSLNKWGYIVADETTQATNLPGVFAGGDIVTGGATVILAMGAGRRAAKAIATWLGAGKAMWPVRAEDVAAKFGETVEDEEEDEEMTESPSEAAAGGPALCPKCHRPLDGDESFICCAGETLKWRCTSCAKVSEGFAFPYGACPHCGGELEVVGATPVENAEALEAIRTAFEIELGGRAFYRRAAARSKDPVLADLFFRFAEMEEEHMHTLERRYHTTIAEGSEDVLRLDVLQLYSGVEGSPDDPEVLFKTAIGLEYQAEAFYRGRIAATTPGSQENRLYQELAAEEREHADVLTTERARWRAGKPGIL